MKHIHYTGDHGHRQGQDSLVKGWSYAAYDKDGNRFVDFLCTDVDKCGHSTGEVVVGVEKSFDRIKMLVPGVKCVSSEGDAGGGGSVQATFDPLVSKGVFESYARFINCLLHAWSRCLQRVCEAVFKRLVELGLARDIEHWKLVKDMVPQSEEMVELMEYQEEYFLQKQSRQRNL